LQASLRRQLWASGGPGRRPRPGRSRDADRGGRRGERTRRTGHGRRREHNAARRAMPTSSPTTSRRGRGASAREREHPTLFGPQHRRGRRRGRFALGRGASAARDRAAPADRRRA
jgi:hypothetical protein